MTSIDVYNDPYSRRREAHKMRQKFNSLKKTSEFKDWYKKQRRHQFNKCAYCELKLTKRVVHVDHINPLYFGGNNDYKNLVLTCKECNLKKWINDRYVRPEWLEQAKIESERLDTLYKSRSTQHKQMLNIVRQEIDEQIAHNELSWLR